MKAALYARVSKEEGSQNMQDPENQLKPLRSLAEGLGWEVFAEYVDYASGGDSNRPQFQKMLADARQHKFSVIVVWALDRFSREGMTNTLSYIKQLRMNNVGLKSIQESWLDTREQGIADLLLGIFSWVAEQEKKRISERTKAALHRKRIMGTKLGRPKLCLECGYSHHKRKQCKTPPRIINRDLTGKKMGV